MKTFKLFSMAALALAMAACSNEDNELENVTPAQQGTMHFTATVAAPGSGAMTRTTYSESGTTINVAWKAGDLIYLLDQNNGATCIAAVGTPAADGSATISGTFKQPVGVGDKITAYYPASAVIDASDVISQEGTLAFIQDKLDLRKGTSTISVTGTEATLATALQMKSQIAIWKLTLQNSSSEALSATKVTVKDGSDLVLGRTKDISATSVVYLALSLPADDITNADITIEATVGSDTYTYSKSGVSLAKGNYYQSTVKMVKVYTLAESTVGMIVGSDGKAYAASDKNNLPSGVTAAGMVAYKNGSNGLVIALADEANTMNWSTATGASGAAAHTPVVTGGTWKLPSKAEWNQMFGDDADTDIANYFNLNTAISTAGGTELQNALYWSSTEFEDGIAYEVELDLGSAYWHNNGDEDYEHCVRACLAF